MLVLSASDLKPESLKTTLEVEELFVSFIILFEISLVILSSKHMIKAPKPIE